MWPKLEFSSSEPNIPDIFAIIIYPDESKWINFGVKYGDELLGKRNGKIYAGRIDIDPQRIKVSPISLEQINQMLSTFRFIE